MNTLPSSVLVKHQVKRESKEYIENGVTYRIKANVRFDDECNNGHNSFSITGDIDEKLKNGRWRDVSGGCIHKDIIKHFPELEKYIKWHLVSTDQPLHYVANTLYHAQDKDCWGFKKGEVRSYAKSLKFDGFPFAFKFSRDFIAWLEEKTKFDFTVEEVKHKDNDKLNAYKYASKYTFKGFNCEWYQCPFDTLLEAEQFAEAFRSFKFEIVKIPDSFGEGKEPDLEAARHTAIWPDATLEQLQSKDALLARLPELMKDFKKDMESLGFTY